MELLNFFHGLANHQCFLSSTSLYLSFLGMLKISNFYMNLSIFIWVTHHFFFWLYNKIVSSYQISFQYYVYLILFFLIYEFLLEFTIFFLSLLQTFLQLTSLCLLDYQLVLIYQVSFKLLTDIYLILLKFTNLSIELWISICLTYQHNKFTNSFRNYQP